MPGTRVTWVLFDLNGTLLDPSGITEAFGGGEAERRITAEAFHEALLLTMADTVSGGEYRPLSEYLRAALERSLRAEGRDLAALDSAMERAAAMKPFPDVAGALARLGGASLKLGVLTNSTAEAAERALTRSEE